MGASKHWFEGRRREINNWRDFETSFSRTFLHTENLTQLWKEINSRVQLARENVSNYFHEKVKLCRRLHLSFDETKEQVVIGLALQRFLGLASYFRRFVKGLSILTQPLYDFMKKSNYANDFKFSEDHLQAFEKVKDRLCCQPILAIYSPSLETEIHCDASAHGYGSVLLQRQVDNLFHPVFYFSRRTTNAESKYHSFELEMLAIVYSLERFRIYLSGLRFKLVTDCNSLQLALKKKDINPQIMRWSLVLHNYDYVLEHRKATQMQHVIALSRTYDCMPVSETTFEQNLCYAQTKDPVINKLSKKIGSYGTSTL